MKKAILIIFFSLLVCNVGFAQVIKYACTIPGEKASEYMNFQIDLDNKSAANQWVYKGKYHENTYTIISADSEKVFLRSTPPRAGFPDWYFYYATDQSTHTPKSGYRGSYNCSYDKNLVKGSESSSSTDDKIAQAKQICKDLGFKTKTEKFADCSLKMLSMQFEVQNRESSSDGGTQQNIVVNQGYSVGDAMIALSGIISDANNVRSSYGGGNCRIFQHAYHASLKCN